MSTRDARPLTDGDAFRPAGPFTERELGLLRDVLAVLEPLGLVTWLDQGTLLGLFRDGRFLEWDHDVDLGTWRDPLEARAPELAARLTARLGETATVAWGRRTIGIRPRNAEAHLPVNIGLYEREGDQAVKWFGRPPAGMPGHRRLVQGMVARYVKPIFLRPTEWLLEAAAGSPDANGGGIARSAARRGARALLELRDRSRDRIAAPIKTRVSARFFEGLQPVALDDVRAFAPREAEAYLALKYGPDWRVPQREWNYWEQDGAIVSD